MSEAMTTNLAENAHVLKLLEIMKENGLDADAKGLFEMVGHVAAVQQEISKAVSEVSAMREELAAMREEQNHPVKTMLQKVTDGLLARLKALQKSLGLLKDKIIDTCKRMVEAFKDQGIAALNGAAVFLDIKHDLEQTRNAICDVMDYKEKQITKIEAASEEMHKVGRSFRNIARVARGKEPVPDIKPNGKLARFIEAPFRQEIRRLNRSLGRVNKALRQLDKLEKAAALRQERGRPSFLKEMREKKALTAIQEPKAPDKIKTAEAEH